MDNPLKIAIISPIIVGIGKDPKTYSSQQINLAKCWAESGHFVDVITGRQKGLGEALSHKRIRLFQRPLLWFGGKGGLPLLLGGYGLLIKNDYDMLLSSEHYQPTTFVSCLLSPNVLVYQGQNTPGSTFLKCLALRILEMAFLPVIKKRYHKVIAKTHLAADFVQDRGFKRHVTIPCGYDSTRFRIPSVEEKEMSRKALGVSKTANVLVYAGNLLPRRDVATAIRALAKLRSKNSNAILLVAGDGPELPTLKQVAKEENISSSVNFLGALNWKELQTVYWAGDIFVFPTHYEIFGMVLIEALACGLKIVSTPCPAAKDIIAACPSAGMITPIGDFDAFAEACSEMLTKRQSSLATDYSIKHYLEITSWNSISTRILENINLSPK